MEGDVRSNPVNFSTVPGSRDCFVRSNKSFTMNVLGA